VFGLRRPLRCLSIGISFLRLPIFPRLVCVLAGFGQYSSQIDERREFDVGGVFPTHQGACAAIEHPQRDVHAVPVLVSCSMAPQYNQLRPAPFALDEQFFADERVPRVLETTTLGFVGSVCAPCITASGTTRDSTTS
jgi:hypothetical protein